MFTTNYKSNLSKYSLGYHDLRVFQEGGTIIREGALIRRNTVLVVPIRKFTCERQEILCKRKTCCIHFQQYFQKLSFSGLIKPVRVT